jgi:hypothetical protein
MTTGSGGGDPASADQPDPATPAEQPPGTAGDDVRDDAGEDGEEGGNDTGDHTGEDRGAAFRRALDLLPVRDGAPPAAGNGHPDVNGHADGNGHGGGNGHASGDSARLPGGAPPKLTSTDEITAPRLEASLAKLLGSAGASKARAASRGDSAKRSRTMPPPEKRPATDRLSGRTKSQRTRIVAPKRPAGASPAKLPPLKPTRLVQAPPKKAPPKQPPAPPAPAAPAPPAAAPPPPAQAQAPAAAAAPGPKISAELADILGNADTSSISRPAATPPAATPPGQPGETTNEFENLLEGLLGDRTPASAIPGEPAGPGPAPAAQEAPNGEGSGFSADTPIFQGPDGGEGNLSDFVSKILGEFDAIVEEPGSTAPPGGVDAPAAPPSVGAGGPPRPQRETVAFEEAFEAMQSKPDDDRETRAEPRPAPPEGAKKRAPGRDTRASKETGEFEEGEGTAPGITPDELSQLSDLFNDD